jgi:hypothetical protein
VCIFITASLPSNVDLDGLQVLFASHGMWFQPIKNSSVEAYLGGDQYFRATRSICECDTALGSTSRRPEPYLLDVSRDVEKLKAKGWKSSKIDRWVADKSKNQIRKFEEAASSKAAELKNWSDFITVLLSGGSVSRLGLILHMYNDTVEHDVIELSGIEKITLSSELEASLLSLDLDKLYLFTRPQGFPS